MTSTVSSAVQTSLPQATLRDSIGVVAGVILPTVAKGVIIRRPRVVAMSEALNLDKLAVMRMQRLRNKYGTGPLMLRIPFRSQAVILSPEDVHRVLDGSPEPFATASSEKRAALSHFEPKNVLISHGAERADRRRFNEEVLETGQIMHRLAERFVTVVQDEAAHLIDVAHGQNQLNWSAFEIAWFRVVRRVIFGDFARDDHELTEMMAQLRANANWAFFKPKQTELRERMLARVRSHIARAEPGSLASVMADTPTTSETAPEHQVPQWLFAFDPAGMATFRTLALLATHPEQAERARKELQGNSMNLPFLRACLLDSLRLWPTTPAVLRQTTRETEWETGVMPAKTSILIYAPFFHRDDQRLPYAHRFSPDIWMERRTNEHWPLIPFSGGPGMCPGRNVVLLLTSAMLAELLDTRRVELISRNQLHPQQPIPGTLNNYSLRFRLSA